MLCKKDKEDNKKTILEDIRVMKLTQEFLELRCTVWVLILMSLTVMVQHGIQHHQSTGSRLARLSFLTAKP